MPPPITSRHNAKVKHAAALRNRKQRDAEGRTLVYGPRETLRAIAAGVAIERAFVCPDWFRGDEAQRASDAVARAGAERLEVTPEVFDKLAYGDRHDGVVSVAAVRPLGLSDLHLPDRPLVAVIEGVEKPGNLGAVLRSADGAGLDAVVIADPVIDLFNPNAIRASVGAVFKRNVAVATAVETFAWLCSASLCIFATRPEAAVDCFGADFTGGAAIVLGGEAHGLTDAWRAPDITPIALPMRGIADSLNVSAAAAVLFYEALRQRA